MIYHPDIKKFFQKAQAYGPIGKAIVSLSDLEHSHDNFVLNVNRRHRQIAGRLSKHFPRQFKEKTVFLIKCITIIPELRTVPIFGDGSLNLQWLQLQLDELYDIRATISHGSIFFSEHHPTGVIYRFDRFVSPEKGYWSGQSYHAGTGFLADVVATCEVLRHYMRDLSIAVLGEYSWDRIYKDEIEMAGNRREMREWVAQGLVEPDAMMSALLNLDEA